MVRFRRNWLGGGIGLTRGGDVGDPGGAVYAGQGFWLCHKKHEEQGPSEVVYPEFDHATDNPRVGISESGFLVRETSDIDSRRSLMDGDRNVRIPPPAPEAEQHSVEPVLGSAQAGSARSNSSDAQPRRSETTRDASAGKGGER